jgi:flagellar motor switch protein FliN/FliY
MDEIVKFDIATSVTDSLIDLFEKMLSMELELSRDDSTSISEDQRIVGSVNLGGMVKGSIIIQVTDEFSRIMTAAMTGDEAEEVERDDIIDVISEVCNIVGGSLKSKFCDAGLICQISPPSFTTGSDFKIESLNIVRHERYVFSHKRHPVIVEVGVRMGDKADEIDKALLEPEKKIKPIDVNKLKDFDISAPVSESMIDLFKTMLSMELEPAEVDMKSGLEGDRIVGSVGFVGPLGGGLNIYVTSEFSRIMTAAMLGQAVEEIEGEEVVKDVISEMCNIVGGNLKSKFCDSGLICQLSTPSFTTGSDFKIESRNMMRYQRLAFRHQGHAVLVEVGVKISESSAQGKPKSDRKRKVNGEIIEAKNDVTAQHLQQAVDDLISEESDEEKVKVKKGGAVGPESTKDPSDTELSERNLDLILDIPIELTVELGRTEKRINEILKVGRGSVIELSNLENEPVNILVNKKLIAKGEVVVEHEKYGVRIIESIDRMERIQSLS